jgi:hypothetical protein
LELSLGAGDLIENLKGSFGSVLAFGDKHGAGAKVEVRLFDIVPTFGAVAIDRDEADGTLFIELNCYSSSGDQCPGFKLENKPNGLFYTYDRQITALWKQALPAASVADTPPANAVSVYPGNAA